MEGILNGKKVAVLVETEYIHFEVEFYKSFFEGLGAQVDFMTYLWGAKERKIVADITEPDDEIHSMTIHKEIADCNVNDYAIVLCAANYVACRLREIPPMGSLGTVRQLRSPAAVRFFASAMENPFIVKGVLCHALWLLTPVPELLKDRKVICHTVVLADVVNAGAIYVPAKSHVVVDEDLVTGRSAADLDAYGSELINAYKRIVNKEEK